MKYETFASANYPNIEWMNAIGLDSPNINSLSLSDFLPAHKKLQLAKGKNNKTFTSARIF